MGSDDGAASRERDTTVGSTSGTWRPFVIFTVATLGFSWSLWALLVFQVVPTGVTVPLIILGGFGPAAGAVVAVRLSGASVRGWLCSNLRVRLPARWYAYALVLPPAFVGLGGVVYATVFGGSLGLDTGVPSWAYPLGLAFVFFLGGGQEEFGWRAFAQPALQEHRSALAASLLVGVVWTMWHLPLFLVPGSSQAGLPPGAYAAGVLATSVVLAWLYNSTRSVLVPMLFHTGVNTAGGFFPAGGGEVLRTLPGYGSYALVLVAVYGAGTLAGRPRATLSVGPDGSTPPQSG